MDTNNNVVTPPQFAARMQEETLNKLRDSGMIVKDVSGFDELELGEPQYGEMFVGTLTEDETLLFLSVHKAKKEFDAYARTIVSNRLVNAGNLIRDHREDELRPDSFDSEEQAKAYFKLECRFEYLRELFYWNLAERLDAYDSLLRVRSKKRIVSVDRKW